MTFVLYIRGNAFKNIFAVLFFWLFSEMYFKTCNLILSSLRSKKSNYIFSLNSVSKRSKTLSSCSLEWTAKQFAMQWPSSGVVLKLRPSSWSDLNLFNKGASSFTITNSAHHVKLVIMLSSFSLSLELLESIIWIMTK